MSPVTILVASVSDKNWQRDSTVTDYFAVSSHFVSMAAAGWGVPSDGNDEKRCAAVSLSELQPDDDAFIA